MAAVEILTPEQVNVGGVIRLVARATNDAGAPDPDRTVTYAIYAPATGLWWNATNVAWEAARVENALPAVVAFDGIYTVALIHADLSPGENAGDWLVEVTSDAVGSPRACSAIFVRHTATSAPIVDNTVADPPDTVVEILRALRYFLVGERQVDDTSKRLIFYRDDGETVAMSFDLSDAAGQASVREVFHRVRVA